MTSAFDLPAHVTLLFAVPFVVFAALFIWIILRHIITAAKNSASPVAAEKAAAVAKRQMTAGGFNGGYSTSYYVTFEFSGGERTEFSVKGKEYGMIAEGDTGILSYQGTRFISFERTKQSEN